MNTYVDAITYQNSATGLILAPLVGNIGRLAAISQGASSLTVTSPLVAALNQYDAVYVTDGPNSEALQVGAGGAAIGALAIPLQGTTAYAHAGGTAYCTDGQRGSLGQAIFEASRWLEDICFQPLWATTYTNEILTLPTMRAALDNQQNLHFRPRHFPITALTGISLRTNQQNSVSYDPTQAIIDSDQMTVDLPIWAALTSQGVGPPQTNVWAILPVRRETTAWLTLTYTAGYAVGAMPPVVTRAAKLLVNDALGILENPIGADEIGQNKRRVVFTLRGDQSGESLLYKQAAKLLSPYVAQSF